MFEIDSDMTLHITRGDVAFFTVAAEKSSGLHKFQPNDVVRIKVMQRKNCDNVAFHKDFLVLEEKETVDIILTENETKIGDTINKPVDYWYEVELNPYTNPQTLIGYDANGPKIFKLYPEGRDLGSGLEPEEIPPVDKELSLTSERPIQNQAVARALIGYDERVILAEQRIESMAKDAEQTVKTNTDNMVENAKAEVEEMTKVVEEAAERVETIAGADIVGIIDGTTQVGNAKTLDGHGAEHFAKAVDLLNYLSKSGGTLTGNDIIPLIISTLVSGSGSFIRYTDATQILGHLGFDSVDKPVFSDITGIRHELLHTGNKPSGSYTGNGSATKRVIETGGIGKMCIINDTYHANASIVVLPYGAFGFVGKSPVYYEANELSFTEGRITIATDSPHVNFSGADYQYEVH